MVTEILNKMAEIVAATMTSFQSDFEKYDAGYISREGVKAFPFLWMIAPTHTYLLKLADFKEVYFENETLRYDIAQNNSWFHAYLYPCSGDVKETIYYVTLDGLREVSVEQAREIVRDIVTPAIMEWEEKHGKIPPVSKIAVKIDNISLGRLKELIKDCRKHGNDSLLECLKRFHSYRRVASNQHIEISYNSGYNEFTFCEMVDGIRTLVGGIIFHGWPETGYQTNNSFQLTPQYGWAIHT